MIWEIRDMKLEVWPDQKNPIKNDKDILWGKYINIYNAA